MVVAILKVIYRNVEIFIFLKLIAILRQYVQIGMDHFYI